MHEVDLTRVLRYGLFCGGSACIRIKTLPRAKQTMLRANSLNQRDVGVLRQARGILDMKACHMVDQNYILCKACK